MYFLSIVILLSDKHNYIDLVYVVYIWYCYMFQFSAAAVNQHQVIHLMMADGWRGQPKQVVVLNKNKIHEIYIAVLNEQ